MSFSTQHFQKITTDAEKSKQYRKILVSIIENNKIYGTHEAQPGAVALFSLYSPQPTRKLSHKF